jgi:hypothetical protein
VLDQRFAGDQMERFTGEAGGGVTGGNDAGDFHAAEDDRVSVRNKSDNQ